MGNNKGNLALAAISEDPEEDRVLERRKETNLTKEVSSRDILGKFSLSVALIFVEPLHWQGWSWQGFPSQARGFNGERDPGGEKSTSAGED